MGLYIQRDAKEPALQLTVYRVTKLGREILALGDYKADDEYMHHLGSVIKGRGFKVNYGDWSQIDAGTGYLANPVEL